MWCNYYKNGMNILLYNCLSLYSIDTNKKSDPYETWCQILWGSMKHWTSLIDSHICQSIFLRLILLLSPSPIHPIYVIARFVTNFGFVFVDLLSTTLVDTIYFQRYYDSGLGMHDLRPAIWHLRLGMIMGRIQIRWSFTCIHPLSNY